MSEIYKIKNYEIEIYKGDITKLNVDAIVNAANSSLLGGGGVDGAIHWAAGPELLKECMTLNGCKTGEAKITKGYKLPAKYVIHTVGPIWRNNETEKEKNKFKNQLMNCYINSIKLANENNIKTIAFPCISTGIYSFPKELACQLSLASIVNNDIGSIEKVIFCCFDEESYGYYVNEMKYLNK